MRNNYFLFVLLFLHSFASSQTNQIGEINGIVIDKKSQLPIPHVNISILKTKFGSVTDSIGVFQIKNIPVGVYHIRSSSIGFKTSVKNDIVVVTSKSKKIIFELEEEIFEINETVVSANLFSKSNEDVASVHKLNAEEIRRSPGAAEDIIRLIQSLPGVSFTGDNKNDLIVRGGSPAENLTIVNGIEFPNINHFSMLGTSSGNVSMIDVKFIDEVNFYSGGFSSKYGDKLSSVTDINLREGDRKKISGGGDLSMAGLGFFAEGPINKGIGAWILSYRKSYVDLLVDAIGLTAVPKYQDLFTKLDYDLNEKNKLSFFAFGGIDKIDFLTSDSEINFFEGILSKNNQYIIGLNWKYLFSNNGFSNFSISHSSYNYFVTQSDMIEEVLYKNISWEKDFNLKYDLTYKLTRESELNFGFGLKRNNFKHNLFLQTDTIDYITENGIFKNIIGWDITKKDFGIKSEIFGNYNLILNEKLKFNFGLRYDYFNYIKNNSTVSPRGSISYQSESDVTLSFTLGKYYQWPVYSWLTITDYNLNLKPLESNHLIFSYEKLIEDDKKFTVEFYNKDYKNYPVLLNNKYFILIDAGTGFSDNIADSSESEGVGYSRGVDIFFQKKLQENFYGLLSYSFSHTKFKAIEGNFRRGSYDNRHVLTLIVGYKKSADIEFSMKFKFASPRPFTPFDENLSKNYQFGVPNNLKLNADEYPSYHRLDLRFDKWYFFKNMTIVTFFELENVYNRKNIYTYFWNNKKNKRDEVYQWAFLPVGGFRIEF